MKNLLLLTALSLFLLNCAEVRNENNIGDVDQERVSKSMLTGLTPEKSVKVETFSDLQTKDRGKIWLHKVTVTNVSSNGGPLFIGLQGGLSAGYFAFNKEGVEFLNAVNPNRVDDNKIDNLIYSWSVDHSQYRYRESNGRPTNSLEEDNFKEWYKKSHFVVDWASGSNLNSGFEEFSACWSVKSAYILPETTEYSEDYMTFTKRMTYEISGNRGCAGLYSNRRRNTGNFTFQADLNYSFKKRENVRDPEVRYEPYVYNGEFDPLIQKYGYFKTIFEERKDNETLKVNFFMNRWNPKVKEHKFYFAPNFPDEYKWIYKTDPSKKDPYGKPVIGIMDRTNEVLEDAGVDMRFSIAEAPEGVKFGDLRYSFIKYMKEPNGSSPLGYGPSDADPFTGEIISANSMVWTASLQRYIDLIGEWLKREDVQTGSAQSFYNEMNKIMGTSSSDNSENIAKWLETSNDLQQDTQVGYIYKRMIPSFTYGLPQWASFTKNYRVDEEGKIQLAPEGNEIFEFDGVSLLDGKLGEAVQFRKRQVEFLETATQFGREHLEELSTLSRNPNRSTIYRLESQLADVQELLLDGKSPQEVIDTILYRVAIHEFGHNISLRHNFYGSVDKINFAQGEKIFDLETGAERHFPAVSSSVMDYLSLDGEMHTSFEWENYDKAAIAYAYSGGKVDHSEDVYSEGHPHAGKKKDFLFCTDEHRFTNALCNTWDLGTTPTEILMSMINNYQRSYFTTNWRFDRAYWDTSGYGGRIFGTMFDIKKFMMLDQATFTYSNEDLNGVFKDLGISTSQESTYFDPIKRDIRRAIKLSIAFYNSVLQQGSVEKPYFSKFDGVTGALTRQGIFADKLYATMFLLGDDSFFYNPNINISTASYLEYLDDEDIGNAIKKVSENLLTQRVDSEPGFISFARLMYADNALNFFNQNDPALGDRMKLTCYSPEKFSDKFGLNPYQYTYKDSVESETLVADVLNAVTDLPEDADLSLTEFANELSDIAIAFVKGNVYVASKAHNEIAFNVIKELRDADFFADGDSSDRIRFRESDVLEMRYLYLAFSGAEDRCL